MKGLSLIKKPRERQPDVLAFCVPLLREAAYELWPESQRVALHRKCAAFLEQHVHTCKLCGQGDFIAFHRFASLSAREGGSCRGPADQGDSGSWEALVLAGQCLKRNRTHSTEDMLCPLLRSPGPPGARGVCWGRGGSPSARDEPSKGGQPRQTFPGVLGALQGSLQACWERESVSYPRACEEVSNPLLSFQTLLMLCGSSSRLSWRRILGEQTRF